MRALRDQDRERIRRRPRQALRVASDWATRGVQGFQEDRGASDRQQVTSDDVFPRPDLQVLFESLLCLVRNQKDLVVLSPGNQLAANFIVTAVIHGAGAGDIVLGLGNHAAFGKPIVPARSAQYLSGWSAERRRLGY